MGGCAAPPRRCACSPLAAMRRTISSGVVPVRSREMRCAAAVVVGLGGCAFDATGGGGGADGTVGSSTGGATTLDPSTSGSSGGEESNGSVSVDDTTSTTAIDPDTSADAD